MPGRGARRIAAPVVAAFLLVGVAATWGADRARRACWTTADEPDHVAACRELRSGSGVVSNFEHPVLMKVLGAAGLPASPLPRTVEEVRAARAAFPFVLGLLVVAAGLWTAARSGPVAGLAVAALVAAEPSLRGHAAFVHTDVLLTALLVAAAALLDLSGPPSAPRRGLLVASGVAYGLALAAKYSALPFLAVFLVAAAARLTPRSSRADAPRGGRRRRSAPAAPRPAVAAAAVKTALLVALPALATALLVQQLVVASRTSREDLVRGVERKFAGYPYHAEARSAAVSLPKGLSAYVAGLLWVRASSVPGERINYFLGVASGTGSFFYFPAALALKLTTALVLGLVAAAVAAGVALARRVPSRRRRLRLLAARSLLPAFLGGAYLGAAMLSNVNIGVRHVLPSVPLFLVAAAGVLRTLAPRRVRVPACAAVVLLAGVEAAAFAGREVPFGNLVAGGPAGLRRVLSDSNVDWGERLGSVFERASRGDLGRVAVFSLFWDEEAGRKAGVPLFEDEMVGEIDTLFVSVFFWDLGPALERSRETWPKIVYFRDWLGPLLRRIRAEAVSIEPFGDEYVLIRLRRPGAPHVPSR